MSKYYYHGIKNLLNINAVLSIIQSGGIKSKRKQNLSYKIGFNGADYVSVCKKVPDEDYANFFNSAFENYIVNKFCFIIDNRIPAIKPQYIADASNWNRFELIKLMVSNPNNRFTDMIDEWQIKDEVPLTYIIGIGIPVKKINSLLVSKTVDSNVIEHIKTVLDKIIEFALNLNIDIVDSSNMHFIEEYESNKEINNRKILNLKKII